LIKISNQIISEREFYYPVTGLLNVLIKGKKVIDESGYAKEAKRIKNDTIQSRKTAITIAIGMFGFFAGPGVYVIDQVSLADAFTARLPVAKRWRIGHFGREWPEGYENTLRQGINLIKDDKMAKFYDKISLITKGKIFSLKRFKAIIDLNIRNDLYETR
jgi:arabinofuranosyltransferase